MLYCVKLNRHSFLITNLMGRETLDFDVVFVGAGPANLSGALHLARLVKDETIRSRLLNAGTPRAFTEALTADTL